MKNNLILIFFGLLLAFVIVASQSLFMVPQTEKALVIELGKPVGEVREPGLNVKLPFIQKVVFVEDRLLSFSLSKESALTIDQKTLDLESYVCWRIVSPLTFVQTLFSSRNAEERLRMIVNAQLGVAIGNKTLQQVVGDSRNEIMESVLKESNKQINQYGVDIIDVRINRADLPASNRKAIFERMKAERAKEATRYLSEGQAQKIKIMSGADLDKDKIIAEANSKSIVIRAKADAYVMSKLGSIINEYPDLYDFLQSIEVYKKSLNSNTKIILSTDSELLKYLR